MRDATHLSTLIAMMNGLTFRRFTDSAGTGVFNGTATSRVGRRRGAMHLARFTGGFVSACGKFVHGDVPSGIAARRRRGGRSRRPYSRGRRGRCRRPTSIKAGTCSAWERRRESGTFCIQISTAAGAVVRLEPRRLLLLLLPLMLFIRVGNIGRHAGPGHGRRAGLYETGTTVDRYCGRRSTTGSEGKAEQALTIQIKQEGCAICEQSHRTPPE